MHHTPRRAKRRRLFVHIGHFKTASSSLQWSLGVTESALRKSGCYLPETGRMFAVSHHKIPWSVQQKDGRYRGPNLVPALVEELHSAPGDRAAISAEDFTLLSEAEIRAMRDALDSIVDCTIVLYLRNPVSMMTSYWTQLTKNGFNRLGLNEYVCAGEMFMHNHIGYETIVRRWESVWGSRNLRIRTLDDLEATGGVVVDWLGLLGLDDSADRRDAMIPVHRSPPWCITELLRELACALDDEAVNPGGSHLPIFEALVNAGMALQPHSARIEDLLSRASLESIRRAFDEGNARIAREYFQRQELFPDSGDSGRERSSKCDLPDSFFERWIDEARKQPGGAGLSTSGVHDRQSALQSIVRHMATNTGARAP